MRTRRDYESVLNQEDDAEKMAWIQGDVKEKLTKSLKQKTET